MDEQKNNTDKYIEHINGHNTPFETDAVKTVTEVYMSAREFEKKMKELFPAASEKAIKALITYADELESENEINPGAFYSENYVCYILAARQYGYDVASRVLGINGEFCFNSWEVLEAASLIKEGVAQDEIVRKAADEGLDMTKEQLDEFEEGLDALKNGTLEIPAAYNLSVTESAQVNENLLDDAENKETTRGSEMYQIQDGTTGKRVIDGYEEKICIQLAGKYTVLAENPVNENAYLVCSIKSDNPLGITEIYNGAATGDYIEAMREFVNRVDGLLETLETERRESGLPIQTLTASDCIPDSQNADWEGKLIIVKPEILAPEYRSARHQLAIVTGGFGASAEARGRAVYVKELYGGKENCYSRFQIAGIADAEKLPEWALAKHRQSKLPNEHSKDKAEGESCEKPVTLQDKLKDAKEKADKQNAARKRGRGDKHKKPRRHR